MSEEQDSGYVAPDNAGYQHESESEVEMSDMEGINPCSEGTSKNSAYGTMCYYQE